jgi:hypothetical protein
MRTTSSVLLCAVAACGGGNSGASFSITVQTDTPPALLALRDGPDADWQAVTIAGGTYTLEAHGPYTVALVCEFPDGLMDIEQWQRTADDERTIASSCASSAVDGSITGHMVQAGQIALGFGGSRSDTPDWDFDVAVANGPQQLVAFTSDRIVRRDVMVNGATPTDALDVTTNGMALVPTALRAPNARPDETLSSSVALLTPGNTFARIYSGDPTGATLIPDGALTTGDHQRVRVSAFDAASASRAVFRGAYHQGDATDFTLPDPLGPVEFTVADNTLTTTWSTLPAHDELTADLDAFSADGATFWFYFVNTTASYIDATGATSVTFDRDIPGYQPRWEVDLAQEHTRDVFAVTRTDTDSLSSSVGETVNSPPARRRGVRPRVPHKLARELQQR